MKRYYICDVVGTGNGYMDPYRPLVKDLGAVNFTAEIQIDPQTGALLQPWALVCVEANNHVPFVGKPGVIDLPDFPLDGKVSAIQTSVKNKMLSRLQARGIDTSPIANTDGYRETIRTIGKRLNPNFDENSFGPAEG